jgi:hypothetical protein
MASTALGSRVSQVHHRTTVAIARVAAKFAASLSYRVAMRRQPQQLRSFEALQPEGRNVNGPQGVSRGRQSLIYLLCRKCPLESGLLISSFDSSRAPFWSRSQ